MKRWMRIIHARLDGCMTAGRRRRSPGSVVQAPRGCHVSLSRPAGRQAADRPDGNPMPAHEQYRLEQQLERRYRQWFSGRRTKPAPATAAHAGSRVALRRDRRDRQDCWRATAAGGTSNSSPPGGASLDPDSAQPDPRDPVQRNGPLVEPSSGDPWVDRMMVVLEAGDSDELDCIGFEFDASPEGQEMT